MADSQSRKRDSVVRRGASPLPPGDLGFGAVVSAQDARLLNPDGSFNVEKTGLGFWASVSPYQAVLTMSWPRFLLLLSVSYLLINVLFAGAFLACGPHALEGDHGFGEGLFGRAGQAFFFSVQTLATIGYGRITPMGWGANLLVTFESMVGIFILTLGTGLFFARFSQPSAKLLFSRQAVIAPFAGGRAFELRVVNLRRSQMIEVEAKVILARFEIEGDFRKRRFYELHLERPKVIFFPLSWTVVHPIDETSPLHGWSQQQLAESSAEFLVLLSGIDEISTQPVHARTSYHAEDVVWGARFVSIFVGDLEDPKVRIDASRLHEIEKAAVEG